MIGKLLTLPIAIIKDVATLGGAVNDGYFSNGCHTYTGKIVKNIQAEIQFNQELKQMKKVIEAIKNLIN